MIYGIMRKRYWKSGILTILFFSKISLRAAIERVRLMGFNVEVHLVEKLGSRDDEDEIAEAA
jgi:uncharacterized protein (TIGR04141 family)